MNPNYIRISAKEWNEPIHRIISTDRLLEIFTQEKNTLCAPHKWEDPFENILERVWYRKHTGGPSFQFPLRGRSYGQCWTRQSNHDAAWRCYSPNRNGVQLTTTIRKLYTSLENTQNEYGTISCFIGRVSYHNERWFANKERIANYFSESTHAQVQTLLWKRDTFRWEKEVRLLFLDPRNENHGDYFKYSIQPAELYSCITLDPRMTPELADSYTQVIRKMNYNGDIIHSTLYRAPHLEISV